MKCSIIGYPRIGRLRELKFWTEKYWKGELTEGSLRENAGKLREEQWKFLKNRGVDFIPSNDFSFYDMMLDTAVLINAVPQRYRELKLKEPDTYFAMARGYQGANGDVKALSMRKWFNTNYHYLVPELDDDTKIRLTGDKPFREYMQAEQIGIGTKPVFIGGFTFLKLARYHGKKRLRDYAEDIINAYGDILMKCNQLHMEWIQIDEPVLVTDLDREDILIFTDIYRRVLAGKGNVKVLLQTYFGDIGDCCREVTELDFDGIGLDFVEGRKNMELIKYYGFPKDKALFAGVINGRNIWKSNYESLLSQIRDIQKHTGNIVLNTSCSLLHVPYTLQNEEKLAENVKKYFSFAEEKLKELQELSALAEEENYRSDSSYKMNQELFRENRFEENEELKKKIAMLSAADFRRASKREVRAALQREELRLPKLPTTTIGSFPQTPEVKRNRTRYRKGEITKEEYDGFIRRKIKECIELQEKLGIDVLVHGEYERNDMVEYFGENLAGFVFTEMAWVQSYGSRCVKPPIISGDVYRLRPITVEYLTFAQSLTDKPVKGMLTGPVTILNWSFPREDIPLKQIAYQIALAIRDEVIDLEKDGIKIIQIDEAALKEKLPLRRAAWHTKYLDWAIPAFRLVHGRVKDTTQIHTHMCYSEFEEIIGDIDAMDADVVTFEASRSDLAIASAIKEAGFEAAVGPGVYDIHSPRVPAVEEIEDTLFKLLKKISGDKLWVNPDCGLKTRGEAEVRASLTNMVKAAKKLRQNNGIPTA